MKSIYGRYCTATQKSGRHTVTSWSH